MLDQRGPEEPLLRHKGTDLLTTNDTTSLTYTKCPVVLSLARVHTVDAVGECADMCTFQHYYDPHSFYI